MKTLYTAHATATGGRDGEAKTDDSQLALKLARPGSGMAGTNPEQLFACGYSACFGSAVEFVAKQQGITLEKIEVKADVDLNQDENGFFISATLNVSLPNLDNASAQKLVEAAHQVCPYSKATRDNIQVTLKANNHEFAKAA